MSAAIILHSDLIPSEHMHFSPMQKTPKGQKVVYINNPKSKARVRVQTPVMRAPFGLSRFDDANTGNASYSLDLSFNGRDQNEKLAKFAETCKALDEYVLNIAEERSEEWFGKKMSREILREFHRPVVREASDPSKYEPTIRLKVTPYSEVYDESRSRVEMDALSKGCTARAIIEPSFWMIGKSFGVSLRIIQVAIVTRPSDIAGFAFAEDGDEGAEAGGAGVDGMAFLD